MRSKYHLSDSTLKYNIIFIIFTIGLLIYLGSKGIQNGPSELEQNFPFRKQMISFFTELRLKAGDRVFQQALVSNNGWLEFTGDGNLDDYQNATPLSPGEINKIQKHLQEINNELTTRRITLLIVVAPNKATIYPEKIPIEIKTIQQDSRFDNFLSYISKHGPQVIIDLRPVLLKAKDTQQVYYQTDTHWNAIGAFYAYKVIINSLSGNHPVLQAKDLDDFSLHNSAPELRDISKLMGATSLLESRPFLTPKFESDIFWKTFNADIFPASISSQPNMALPKAIIYHDSFGEGLKPYLSLHFSSSLFVHRASEQTEFFSYAFIDQFNPNIIIIEIVERNLPSLQSLLDKFN